MSETMSTPSDWAQFFQHKMVSSGINPTNIDPTIEISSSNHHHQHRAGGSSGSTATQTTTLLSSPEGRVSKPARKRSRASRRTPTTLLNTDTTNFRAMVQQFTGGGGGGPSLPLFGSATGHPGAAMLPPGYNRLQYQQQNQPPWMISLSNNSQADHHHHHHQHQHQQGLFVQRGNNNMEMSNGFAMESISSPQVAGGGGGPVRAPPTSENRGNSFMF